MQRTFYYEPTIWDTKWTTMGPLPQEASDININEILRQEGEYNILQGYLERFAIAQMTKLNGMEPKFFIGLNGNLRYQLYLDDSTDERVITSHQVYDAYKRGIYARHQFHDHIGDNNLDVYAKWYDLAKDSYLFTIPFKQLLELSDWTSLAGYSKDLKRFLEVHCNEELTKPNEGLGFYSIDEFKGCLEGYLEPYIIARLTGTDVNIEEIDGLPHLLFTTRDGKKAALSFYSKEIYGIEDGYNPSTMQHNQLTKWGNSYEYLFKRLGLPIVPVVNSVVGAIDPSKLPYEEHTSYCYSEIISDAVKAATDTEMYGEARSLTQKSSYFNY